MSKKVIKMILPSQAERLAVKRCTNGVQGAISGATKIEGNKGRKVYSRKNVKPDLDLE